MNIRKPFAVLVLSLFTGGVFSQEHLLFRSNARNVFDKQ